jgi:alpha-beta hydrolase superfamily lysophospholipase
MELKATMFELFPGNYRWSYNAHLSLAAGGQFGDVALILPTLQANAGNDEVWHESWDALSDVLVKRAETAETPQGKSTHLLLATLYKIMAEHFVPPTDPRRLASYKEVLALFDRAQAHSDNPTQRVAIPYGSHVLHGYFLRAAEAADPAPTVIFICGLDTTKELWFLRARQEFSSRGMNCLFVDTPGIGEALRIDKIPTQFDYERPISAIVDFLELRSDVAKDKIGLVGSSLGGYYVARATAFEKRIQATVAWGAIWDYHSTWVKRLKGNGVSGAPPFQLLYVTGTSTTEAALQVLAPFKVGPVAKQIACPFLIMHGSEDRQVSVEDANTLYGAIASSDKELKIFDGLSGGAAHTQFDNHLPALHYAADWLWMRLLKKMM